MWYGLCVRKMINGDFDVQYVKSWSEESVEDDLAHLAANTIDITGDPVDVFTVELDSEEYLQEEIHKINYFHEKPDWLMKFYR